MKDRNGVVHRIAAAVPEQRRELDAETHAVFVAMLATLVAPLHAKQLQCEWRQVA